MRTVVVRPGDELEWLRNQFLPAVRRLYAVLAQASVVPAVRGRPKCRLFSSVQAVYLKEQRKLSMLKIGKTIARMEQLESRKEPVNPEDLKKVGRRYVKEGRGFLSQQRGEGDWPPHLVGKGHVPPRDLRRHFQEMTIRAVARWLANEARAHCDTGTSAYDVLVAVLDETSVMSRITWFLQPD